MITEVIVKDVLGKGQGVFALRHFTKGEFIFRRRHGKVVAKCDIVRLSEEDQRHLCELDWETSAVLLSPGCYLNHSCDPNAMRKGDQCVCLERHLARRGNHHRLSAERL